MENRIMFALEIDENQSNYKIKGSLNAGLVKMLVGELELIKLKLLSDLEKSLNNENPTGRFEFD